MRRGPDGVHRQVGVVSWGAVSAFVMARNLDPRCLETTRSPFLPFPLSFPRAVLTRGIPGSIVASLTMDLIGSRRQYAMIGARKHLFATAIITAIPPIPVLLATTQ